MIKVLFIIDQLLRGGAERLLLDLLARMPQHGVQPVLCVLGRELKMLPDFKAAGIEPILLKAGKWNPGVVSTLCDIMSKHKIDLINSHLGKSVLVGTLVASRTGIPLVAHDHVGSMWPHFGGGPLKRGQDTLMWHLAEWCMQRSDAVIAVSEPSRQWLIRRHPELEAKTITINNGIDLERMQEALNQREKYRADVRQEFDIPEKSHIILYTASFRPVKGWGVFVAVAENLCQSHPDVHFIGAGTGPLHDEFLTQVSRGQYEHRIHLPGSREDVPRLMAAADVYLMPTEMESDGIVAKEAMALGLPVVASDLPVLRDKVTSGRSGFLVPVRDVQGFSEASERLLTDAALSSSVGSAALLHAVQHFDIENCVEKTRQLFCDVLEGAQGQ